MESLTSQFEKLQVSKTALYDFVKKMCIISVMRAYFYAEERNNFKKNFKKDKNGFSVGNQQT